MIKNYTFILLMPLVIFAVAAIGNFKFAAHLSELNINRHLTDEIGGKADQPNMDLDQTTKMLLSEKRYVIALRNLFAETCSYLNFSGFAIFGGVSLQLYLLFRLEHSNKKWNDF